MNKQTKKQRSNVYNCEMAIQVNKKSVVGNLFRLSFLIMRSLALSGVKIMLMIRTFL